MSALTGALLLPADVVLAPVGELAEAVRRQLRWEEGDHAITRPGLRTSSRLVDAQSAALLRQFSSPRTVVEAVIRHSRACGADPEATLEAAYPLLAQLADEGFLVAAGAAARHRIEASWGDLERVAGCAVLRCVQVLEDTEVYQVREGLPSAAAARGGGGLARRAIGWPGGRRELALKIERPPAAAQGRCGPDAEAGRAVANRLLREAAILDHLARPPRAPRLPGIAPRLAACGLWQERRFLVLEWCPGVDAESAAAELRDQGEAGRPSLLALCVEVVRAYARLHGRGVLHCDIHPCNVLVAADGSVRLIDFGLAQWRGAPAALPEVGRGGVAFYFEPEYAAAVLAGQPAPPATAAGEQYGIAALLYALAAGAPYLDFSLERDTLLRQIAERPPLPFAARGAAAWPRLEAVLGRALAKRPDERFPTLDELAAALAELEPERAAGPGRRSLLATGTGRVAGAGSGAAPGSLLQPALAGAPATSSAVPSLTSALRRAGAGDCGERLLADTLVRLLPGGALWNAGMEPPAASLQHGAAGIACFLYRLALARDDAELLSQADLWGARAAAAVRGGDAGDPSGVRPDPGSVHAAGASPNPAFYNPALGLTPDTIGSASLYHGAPGVHGVEALIANSLDDSAAVRQALTAFVGAARQACPCPDLALGRSGLLLGCALLLDATASRLGALAPPTGDDGESGPGGDSATPSDVAAARQVKPPPETSISTPGSAPLAPSVAGDAPRGVPATPVAMPAALLALGDELLAGLWQEIAPLPAISACAELPNLGIAHGWAGYLYATLRWCQAARRTVPAHLAGRLDELAATAESWRRGVRWRWHGMPADLGGHLAAAAPPGATAPAAARWMAGWCNGSAGMVHLFTLAARLLADERAWQLACAAGWYTWEAAETGGSLCCGIAGRAYALLELYRQGAGAEWLARARALAARAAASEPAALPDSLYRGRLGVALLAADLVRPAAAAMPLFADEGWSSRRGV